MKALLIVVFLFGAICVRADQGDTAVLLTPIDASRAGSYDWGLVMLSEPSLTRGGTEDRGAIRVNVDMAKFFQEGYAIYSITRIERKDQNTPTLLVLLVRVKKAT